MYEEEQAENENENVIGIELAKKIRKLSEDGLEKVNEIAKASTMEEKLELLKEYDDIIKNIKNIANPNK